MINLTPILKSTTNCKYNFMRNQILLSLLIMVSASQLNGQLYHKFTIATGGVLNNTPSTTYYTPVSVAQSTVSTYTGTVANFQDANYTNGARTLSSGAQWISVNLGSFYSISIVQLAALTSANLNGASIQTSLDNVIWTTVVASISGATNTAMNNFSFTPITAQYIRVSKTGTVDISEFRVVNGNAALSTVIVGGTNSGVSVLQNIGFNFTMNGTIYSQFSCQVDGMMRLGGSVIVNETTNNIVSSTNSPKLFPYWDDISTGTLVSGGGVTYALTGVAPNRILIVSWKNYNSTSSGATNTNFQTWLYETTNKIEYRYGAGLPAGSPSASIGIGGSGQTFGPSTAMTQFISVSPNATPANSTISYMKNNDAVTIWPGNGTIYSFTPTTITPTVSILSDGNGATEDFNSLDNALGAINWNGIPASGITINVQGGLTETVPAGISTSIKYSGLILTATGTATKPIVIQWTGLGAKPILTANAGIGLNDYIFAMAGSDYVTFNGFKLNENWSNATAPSNNKWTEFGIVMFKYQMGSYTVSANGCQNNTIKNNDIRLERKTNGSVKVRIAAAGSGRKDQNLPAYSKGIGMVYWDPILNGTAIDEDMAYQVNTTGILNASDVNSYNEFYTNTIDSCYYGIWSDDRYNGTTIASRGNIIGKVSLGNTVSNFGATTGINYDMGGSLGYKTNSITVPKAIHMGGSYDATIIGNTIIRGNANEYRVFGIEFGAWEIGLSSPLQIGKVNISYNSIRNLFANNGSPSGNNTDALGIVFVPGNNWLKKQLAQDSVIITYNTLDSFNTILGKAHGITTGPVYNDASYTKYSDYSLISGSNNYAIINNNSISKLKSIGSGSSVIESVCAIYWGANYGYTRINNNAINGMQIGSTLTKIGKTSYITGIMYSVTNIDAYRNQVDINDNNISNNNGFSASDNSTRLVARMIYAKEGGAITNILRDTISNNSMTYANENKSDISKGFTLIAATANQSSGAAVVNIKYNQLLNNIRRGINTGSHSFLTGIFMNNTAKLQIQNISNNTINGLKMYNDGAAAASTLTILSGIRVSGSTVNSSVIIDSNVITGLMGDKVKTSLTVAGAGSGTESNYYAVRGIVTYNTQRIDVRKNVIYNLVDSSAGTGATYLDGVCGIALIGGSTKTLTASNNFVYDLYAPNIVAPIGINGISVVRAGFFYVDHNTVVIGNPMTLVPVTSSSATFGVAGIMYAPTTIFTRRIPRAANYYTFRNNLIALQVTNKGTGASMSFRQTLVSAANATPGDITTKTNGNVYYINTGAYNYLYGQGSIGNTSGGIRNCFAMSGATNNATHNLVSTPDFNQQCSKYEKFMKGAENITYAEVDGTGFASGPPPFAGGALNPNKYYVTTGSTSFAYNAVKLTRGVTINDDYAGIVRPNYGATAGAKQSTGVAGPSKSTLIVDYDPLDFIICPENPTLVVSITKAVSSVSVGTGAWAPRVYYKTAVNQNRVPTAAQNNNTYDGWKFATPSLISGTDYSFLIDLALLQPVSWTVPQTIEYFVIAADDSTYLNKRFLTVNGSSFDSCIKNVDLYKSGNNSNTAHVPQIDVSPRTQSNAFDIISGTSLTRKTRVEINNVVYTADNGTSINACPGDTIRVKGSYTYTPTGETFNYTTYELERATNTAFTTGVIKTLYPDSNAMFVMGAYPSDIYARMWLNCLSSHIISTNTPYVRFTSLGCPTVTSVIPDVTICVADSVIATVTNTNTGTNAVRTYFLSSSKGKTQIKTGTNTSITSTFRTVLEDTFSAGVWSATAGLTKITLNNGGFLQAALAADIYNQNSDLTDGIGIAIKATDFMKLNSVRLFDDIADGENTINFKVVLYEANSNYKLFETGNLTVLDGDTLSVLFNNWVIAPGYYYMVIEDFDLGTPMTGSLISPITTDFPYSIGADLRLLGGIQLGDTNTVDNQYNYFLDWNITAYCTAVADSFNVNLGTTNIFSCSPYFSVKGNAGVTNFGTNVSLWSDFSGRNNNLTQITVASQPTSDTTNLVNFNSVIQFAASKFMNAQAKSIISGTGARQFFAVANPNSATVQNPIVCQGDNSTYFEIYLANNTIGVGISNSNQLALPYTNSLVAAPKLGNWALPVNGRIMDCAFELNGLPIPNTSVDISAINNPTNVNYIGSTTNGNTKFSNVMCEIMHYPFILNSTEENQVQSYLALKWGITLDQVFTPTNYLNSASTIIWDATGANQTYRHKIAGIGRDDISGLYQKQSQSQEDISANTLLAMGLGTIANRNNNNTNTMSNNSFLIWGDDSASISEQTTEVPVTINLDGVCGQGKRLGREWLIQKTGTIPALQIKFNLINLGINGRPASRFKLAFNSTSDFTNATTFVDATSFVNGVLTFDNVNITDAISFMTVITDNTVNSGPGGVSNGLTSWFRMDNKTTGVIAATVGTLADENGSFNLTRNALGNAVINNGSATSFNFNKSLTLTANAALSKNGLNENDVFSSTQGAAYSVGLIPTSTFVSNIAAGTRLSGIHTAANYNNTTSAFTSSAATRPNIFGMISNAATNVISYTNGLAGVASIAPGARTSGVYTLNMGTNGAAAPTYNNSVISEAFSYGRTLSAGERNVIESYLAIKYGITLNQTVAQNYLASDGTTVIWDATANAVYSNNIGVIARDDCSQLNQKQSRSVNTSNSYANIVAIGLGSIANDNNTNGNSFDNNKDFLAWGDDTINGFKNTEYPVSLSTSGCVSIRRLNKEWKVQTSGMTSAVQLRFYLSGLVNNSTNISGLKLLIDNDNNFGNGGTRVIDATAYDSTNKIADFSGVTFANGEFFTLVTDMSATAPGNVATNLRMWLRADKGISVATGVNLWEDQSSNANNAIQNTAGNQPIPKNNTTDNINFNPVVDFTAASNHRMTFPNTMLNAGTGDYAVYIVNRRGLAAQQTLISFGTATTNQGFDMGYNGTTQTMYNNTSSTYYPLSGISPYYMPFITKYGFYNLNKRRVNVNGKVVGLDSATTFNLVQNVGNIGMSRTGNYVYDGEVAEIIVYQTDPSGTNNSKIESYLAVKYGLTLDQTVATNYISSTGDIIWNGTTNAAYKTRIFGIGMDNCSGLNQKQSRAILDTNKILTVSLGTMAVSNNANTGAFTNDSTYILLGDNNGSLTEMNGNLPTSLSTCSKRLTRMWKASISGTATAVEMRYDFNTVSVTGTVAADFKLLLDLDGDGNFATGTVTMINAISYASKILIFSGVTIPNGAVIAVVTKDQGVGTVTLTPVNTELTTSTACTKNGWVSIYDPADSTKKLFSVYPNGNTFTPSNIKVNTGFGFTTADLNKANRLANKAITLMQRLVQVFDATGGNDTINGGMIVRYYYNPAEKTDAINRMTQLRTDSTITGNTSWNWFKSEKSIPEIISQMTGAGIGGPSRVWITNPDSAGTEDGVTFAEFRRITEFSTFGGGMISGGNWNILPIKLLEFKGSKVENTSSLNWTTASEKNASHFEIERAADGKTWTTIGKVSASGNSVSTKKYNFIDAKPISGMNYYRLKLVDLDGFTEHSKIVNIDFDNNTGINVVVYPNPVLESFTIDAIDMNQNELSIKISNTLGEILYSDQYTVEGNLARKTIYKTANMSTGIYILMIQNLSKGTQSSQHLFIK